MLKDDKKSHRKKPSINSMRIMNMYSSMPPSITSIKKLRKRDIIINTIKV